MMQKTTLYVNNILRSHIRIFVHLYVVCIYTVFLISLFGRNIQPNFKAVIKRKLINKGLLNEELDPSES